METLWRGCTAAALLAVVLGCQRAGERAGEEETAAQAPAPAAGTPEWKIQNALSAGPPAITTAAAVMDWPEMEGGPFKELRAGTNGWACFPDVPRTPGNDPMCLDPSFQAWAAAWMSKTKPEIKQVGFGYMLQGGSDASNTDPFATQPGPEGWVESGPHVMMVTPDLASLATLPTDHKSGVPWVMWSGTPYAHLMVPAK